MLITEAILGETTSFFPLASANDHMNAALCLVKQAKKQVLIYSYDLDASVYDYEALVAALSHLGTKSRLANIKVLINNSDRIVQYGHRLVTLSQRISSHFTIRKFIADAGTVSQFFLTVDQCGFLYRNNIETYSGKACFNSKSRVKIFNHTFYETWDRSETDPELRRLYL